MTCDIDLMTYSNCFVLDYYLPLIILIISKPAESLNVIYFNFEHLDANISENEFQMNKGSLLYISVANFLVIMCE